MRQFLFIALCLAPLQLPADPVRQVSEAAMAAFDRMPDVEMVSAVAGNCGADQTVHPSVAYCTARNVILLARSAAELSQTSYFVAHAFGHAVQVQHGVADAALREIRARPEDEAMLRGWVERQVDCIAGFILAQAGQAVPDLQAQFNGDPLDRPHWGRDPLTRGPHLPVPVADRSRWLEKGHGSGLSACVVGEFDAVLLVSALKG